MSAPVSRQKVSAAFRRSGIRAAKWEASGMVRGWGDWSSGVRVVQDGDKVRAYWQSGRHARITNDGMLRIEADLANALTASRIAFTFEGGQFVIGEQP